MISCTLLRILLHLNTIIIFKVQGLKLRVTWKPQNVYREPAVFTDFYYTRNLLSVDPIPIFDIFKGPGKKNYFFWQWSHNVIFCSQISLFQTKNLNKPRQFF